MLLVACSGVEPAGVPSQAKQVVPEEPSQVVADPDSGVDWQRWSAEAFAAADRQQRPVLLYTSRTGCSGLFAGDDPLARWQAETRYIPVRIDPDRHPAVVRRYAAAGCPSLSILLADGREIVRATDIRRQNVPLLLSRMHEHLQKRRAVVEKEVEEAPPPAYVHALSAAAVRAAIVVAYDSSYGGFGGPFKFPEAEVLLFLQELRPEMDHGGAGRMVQRTLDGLLASPLWDGDVLAMSYSPDWQSPRSEAYAADQAGLLIVLARAATGSVNYLRAGQQLFDTIARDWFDVDRGAFLSRRPEPLIQADVNALLIRACLKTGKILDRKATAQHQAVAAGEVLLEQLVAADGAVAHVASGPAAVGLLRDQMLVALAFDDLTRLTGREEFARAAHRVRVWTDEHLWDESAGVFADAAPQSWPASWTAIPDDTDDRMPSGLALAAEALAAAGDTTRALRILQGTRLLIPADRRHAAAARQLLILQAAQ